MLIYNFVLCAVISRLEGHMVNGVEKTDFETKNFKKEKKKGFIADLKVKESAPVYKIGEKSLPPSFFHGSTVGDVGEM